MQKEEIREQKQDPFSFFIFLKTLVILEVDLIALQHIWYQVEIEKKQNRLAPWVSLSLYSEILIAQLIFVLFLQAYPIAFVTTNPALTS